MNVKIEMMRGARTLAELHPASGPEVRAKMNKMSAAVFKRRGLLDVQATRHETVRLTRKSEDTHEIQIPPSSPQWSLVPRASVCGRCADDFRDTDGYGDERNKPKHPVPGGVFNEDGTDDHAKDCSGRRDTDELQV